MQKFVVTYLAYSYIIIIIIIIKVNSKRTAKYY